MEIGNETMSLIEVASKVGMPIFLSVLAILFFGKQQNKTNEFHNKLMNIVLSALNMKENSECSMEQVRIIQSTFFDLSKYEFYDALERIFYENNLHDREQVKEKIVDFLSNLHHDRNSKFDNFKYQGKTLSTFANQKWINKMTDVGIKCIYISEKEFKPDQTFYRICQAYDHIKVEFYQNVIAKS